MAFGRRHHTCSMGSTVVEVPQTSISTLPSRLMCQLQWRLSTTAPQNPALAGDVAGIAAARRCTKATIAAAVDAECVGFSAFERRRGECRRGMSGSGGSYRSGSAGAHLQVNEASVAIKQGLH
jgi:hypothetical protein